MAFMVPIIKPGWNIYNCNPPPKIRYVKRYVNSPKLPAASTAEPAKKPRRSGIMIPSCWRSTSSPKPSPCCSRHISGRRLCPTDSRFCKNSSLRLGPPQKAVKTDSTQLTNAESTNFRRLKGMMQPIPEEEDEVDGASDSSSTSDGSDSLSCLVVSSNPELLYLHQPSQQRRAQRLFAQFRKLFRSLKNSSEKPSVKKEKKSPKFLQMLQRRRS